MRDSLSQEHEQSSSLPDGWAETTVGKIYTMVGGGTPNTKKSEYWGGEIPWISSADIHGLREVTPRRTVTEAGIEDSATNVVPEGSLIVVTRVGLGKVAIAPTELCFSQDSQALIENDHVFTEYALYYLSTAVQSFKYQGRGTTISGVTKKQLAMLPFFLPPLNEQRRIVAKIEELFAKLDAGVRSLEQARAQLKAYRRSVLKAAVEGELSREWREARGDELEPASELLERILQERRERFSGRKYKEPAFPDKSKLPALPDGWVWATGSQVTTRIVDGTHHTPTYVQEGVPFISVKDVRGGTVHFEDCKYISEEEHQELKRRCNPESGDVLITKSGTIGRTAVVNTQFEFSLFVSVALLKRASNEIDPRYLRLMLDGYIQGINIQQVVKGGVIKNLHLEDLRIVPLSLAPIEEQGNIVEEVERRLSVVDKLEATVEANLKQASALRQSILKQAFSGELVPQDPDDEPASVLLERIKAEREAAKPRARKKTDRVRRSVSAAGETPQLFPEQGA